MENVLRKSFTGVELKKDKPGSFTARIATLNVVDKDGDVTLPGAFPAGKTILISAYQHGSWMGELPVGKGIIREEGNEVFVDGEFNLGSATGKEHYETVKFAPELQEWSYGFLVKALAEDTEWNSNPKVWRVFKALDVFEASPVLRGAGVNTATTNVKSEDQGTTYASQSETVLAAVNDLVERTKALAALRRKEGRDLSVASKAKIAELRTAVDSASAEIKALLESPDKPTGNGKGERDELQKAAIALLKTYSQIQITEVS